MAFWGAGSLNAGISNIYKVLLIITLDSGIPLRYNRNDILFRQPQGLPLIEKFLKNYTKRNFFHKIFIYLLYNSDIEQALLQLR